MRRGEHAGMLDQRIAVGGFLSEHVERRAAEASRVQGRDQRPFVQQPAARGVDQQRTGLHRCELCGAQQRGRVRRGRRVQGDDVGLGQEILQRDQLGPDAAGALLREKRIVCDGPHFHRLQAPSHGGPDHPEADNPGGLASQLRADECGSVPFAGAQRRVGRRQMTRQREEQGDGQLGRGDRVAAGGVEDDDAAFGGRVEVDVVDAGSSPADDSESGRCFD